MLTKLHAQLNQAAASVPLMRANQNIPNRNAPACAGIFVSDAPEPLDVVVVSTLRPALLDLTLHSFYKYFLYQFKTTRLILNVDPIGERGVLQEELVAIAHRYSDLVISRTPAEPSFARAVQWGWSQVTSPFFLHLEDDWLLTKPAHWGPISQRFASVPNLASVRLNLTRNPPFTPPTHDGISLNPSLFRRDFIHQLLPHFDCTRDPEKQWRTSSSSTHSVISPWAFEYYGKPREVAYVIDTGKKWRRAHQLQKQNADGKTGTFWNPATTTPAITTAFHHLKYRFFLACWRRRVGHTS